MIMLLVRLLSPNSSDTRDIRDGTMPDVTWANYVILRRSGLMNTASDSSAPCLSVCLMSCSLLLTGSLCKMHLGNVIT